MKFINTENLLHKFDIVTEAETLFCKYIHEELKNILNDGDEIRFKTPIKGDTYATQIYAVMKVKGIIMAEYDYKDTGKIVCCDKAVQPYYANIQVFKKLSFAINDSRRVKHEDNIVINKAVYTNQDIVVCI